MGRFTELSSSLEVGSFDDLLTPFLVASCSRGARRFSSGPRPIAAFRVPGALPEVAPCSSWFLQSRPFLQRGAHFVETQCRGTRFQISPPIIAPFLSRHVASSSPSIWSFAAVGHISPQLDVCQGGFSWSADVLVSSIVDVLSSRRSTLTFVAFVDMDFCSTSQRVCEEPRHLCSKKCPFHFAIQRSRRHPCF